MKNTQSISSRLHQAQDQAESSLSKFWLWWGVAITIFGAVIIVAEKIF